MNNQSNKILKVNSQRKNYKDVFNTTIFLNASYDGLYDIPCIKRSHIIPEKLLEFSKCFHSIEFSSFIHFYEEDYMFERIWKNPDKYLKILSKFKGVILPDFSIYRDMPLVMQLWNIFRSRAIGNYLQNKNICVIPNIRFGDNRTYEIACAGISKKSIISIGTYGSFKNNIDRKIIITGIKKVIDIVEPETLIIYGSTNDEIQQYAKQHNVRIIAFDPYESWRGK